MKDLRCLTDSYERGIRHINELGALLGMNYKYEKGAVQTLANLKIMYDLATLIPAILFGLMALILFVYYPLSKKKVDELQTLKEARLKEAYENNKLTIQ